MHIDWENIAIHWTKYAHRFQCGRHRLALSPDQMMSTCSATNPGKITMTVTMLEQNPDLWSQREEGKESVLDTIRNPRHGGAGRPGEWRLPRQSRHLYRPANLRARDEAHLRGQLDLSGAREPDPEQERLFHDLYGPSADLHPAQS